MKKINKIKYILDLFYRERISAKSLVAEFDLLYNKDPEPLVLNTDVSNDLKMLSEVCDRFSSFPSDFEKFPDIFKNEKDLRNIVMVVYNNMQEH